MQMVEETVVPHPTKTEVPHTYEEEVATTIEVTPEIVIEVPTPYTATEAPTLHTAIEAPCTYYLEITLPVGTYVTAPYETNSFLIDASVHTDGGFPGGISDYSILTGYADHVAFRLWQEEVRTYGLKMKKLFEM
ncbi:unnamed protein product [Lathyrus sativus]|nr:unnamed protein product [Lathyrus sativus]